MMIKKRNLGDIVFKKSGAGFIGERLKIRIPSEKTLQENFPTEKDPSWNQSSCMICSEKCIEFANLEVLNDQNEFIGWVYHVSECEMED